MAGSASFVNLQNLVVTETNRPDLINTRIASAIQAATLKMHGLDYFPKDLLVADVQFDTPPNGLPAYIQELDTGVLTRFRAWHMIRKWDPMFNSSALNPSILPPMMNNSLGIPVNPALATKKLDILAPNDIFDEEYKTERVDIAYVAGGLTVIKSSTALPMVKAVWYAWPNIDAGNGYAGYSSWIADNYPMAIVYEATATVFAAIGMVDQAREIRRPANADKNEMGGPLVGQINAILTSEIVAEGY